VQPADQPRLRGRGLEVFAATAADAHRTPATLAMLEILAGVAARYESRRPQLQLVVG
jgi:hypothetical protein